MRPQFDVLEFSITVYTVEVETQSLYCLCCGLKTFLSPSVSLKEVDKLIARYRQLDKSKTMTDGVTLTDMLAIPEFVGHPFVRDIITLAGRDTGLEGAKTAGANKNPSNPTNKESIKNALQDSITEEEEDKIRFNVDNFVKLAGKMSSRVSVTLNGGSCMSIVQL